MCRPDIWHHNSRGRVQIYKSNKKLPLSRNSFYYRIKIDSSDINIFYFDANSYLILHYVFNHVSLIQSIFGILCSQKLFSLKLLLNYCVVEGSSFVVILI